jgi:hypothetical protein
MWRNKFFQVRISYVLCFISICDILFPDKQPDLPFFLILIVEGGVQMGPLGTSATDWPIVPAPGDYDDGEFGGIKIGRGNRSTRRKPARAPLCPPQIPLYQTRARTRAAWEIYHLVSKLYPNGASKPGY